MNRPEFIILHHSFTEDNQLKNWDEIRRYHMEDRGWRNIGYHWGIEQVDGVYEIFKGRDEIEDGAHCKEQGMNRRSIGICCVGNFDEKRPPKEQLDELVNLIKNIRSRYGNLPLKYHRDYAINPDTHEPYKSCPGWKFPSIEELESMISTHWAEMHFENLKAKGIEIHEKRLDDAVTRGELFAILDRIVD